MLDEARLKELLQGFSQVRIAVIGDFFLDKWLLIDRSLDEPSVETGLTAYQVTGKRLAPGAAGTVTNNLSALGVGKIYAVGFVGNDGEGFELMQGLGATGVITDYLYCTREAFTPTYIKPLFMKEPYPEETHRLDIRNRHETSAEIEEIVIGNLYNVCDDVDAVIALDQVPEENTGVITARVRETLAEIGRSRLELIVYADSRAHALQYKNVIVKCNHLEAIQAVYPGWEGTADEDLIAECALSLSERTGRQVFVTWGENGIVAVRDNEVSKVPAVRVEGPIDICGAGDSATAGIVCALCRGASAEEAAMIANLAASITIQQIGTTGTATREAILRRFKEAAV